MPNLTVQTAPGRPQKRKKDRLLNPTIPNASYGPGMSDGRRASLFRYARNTQQRGDQRRRHHSKATAIAQYSVVLVSLS